MAFVVIAGFLRNELISGSTVFCCIALSRASCSYLSSRGLRLELCCFAPLARTRAISAKKCAVIPVFSFQLDRNRYCRPRRIVVSIFVIGPVEHQILMRKRKRETIMKKLKMPHAMHDDHLCYLVNMGYMESSLDDYKKLIKDAKFVCKKCGRSANDKENLCRPGKI